MKTKVLQKQMDAGGGGRRAFMSRNSIMSRNSLMSWNSIKSLKSFLAIAVLLLLSVNQVWAQSTPTVLFHETFGNNTGSARNWSDSYSVKSGVAAVYSGITGYTITDAKQTKNTMGSTESGLIGTTGTDAVFIAGPLNVSNYSSMNVTYQWKAGSTSGTYYAKLYYATSQNGTYTEVTGTGSAQASSFVARSFTLPEGAQVSTLYLKAVWKTSNTQATIDEFDLTGTLAITYTDYLTECVSKTPLDKVTGLSATATADGASLSWTAVSNVYRYKVETTADGDNWTVLSSSVTGNSYTVTGLNPCDYRLWRVTALADPSSATYSDGETSDEADFTVLGYTFTYTLSNVTKTAGAERWNCGSSDAEMTFEAAADYVLPATISVTVGGVALDPNEYDYLWDNSDGSLSIAKEKITGAVVVTITGEKQKFTLGWDLDGGVAGTGTITAAGQVAWGTVLQYTVNPTKAGYSFTGWNPTMTSGTTTMPKSNQTYTAQWGALTPTITVDPASATYTVGDDAAVLSVTATLASGTLGHQWQSSSDNSNWNNISGATSSSYKPSTSSAGITYYRCVVSNATAGSGSATSGVATITVKASTVKYHIFVCPADVWGSSYDGNGVSINYQKTDDSWSGVQAMILTGFNNGGKVVYGYEMDVNPNTSLKTLQFVNHGDYYGAGDWGNSNDHMYKGYHDGHQWADIPATSDASAVYLVGSFNGWVNADANYALTRVDNNHYKGTFVLNGASSNYEFKVYAVDRPCGWGYQFSANGHWFNDIAPTATQLWSNNNNDQIVPFAASGRFLINVEYFGNYDNHGQLTVTRTALPQVTYAKGGSGDVTGTDPASASYAPKEQFDLPNNPYTRNGYDFAGWNDGTSTYAAGATYTMGSSNVTMTAQWSAKTYNLTYDNLQGTTQSNPETYTIETETFDLTAPSARAGYNFTGWTCGGNPITQIVKGSTGDKTISATWAVKTYSNYRTSCAAVTNITLEVGAHGTAAGSATAKQGSATLTNYVAVAPSGPYTLAGYYSGDTKVIDNEGHLVSNVTGWTTADGKWDRDDASVTLTAHWDNGTINLVLNKNLGKTNGSATVVMEATALSTCTHAIGQDNYHLEGYYNSTEEPKLKVLNADGSFAATNVTGYIENGKWIKEINCDMFANWVGDDCEVYFHDNNDNPTPVTTYKFGEACTLPAISGGCSGYTAEGWTTVAPTDHAWATKPATTAAGTNVNIDATEKHFYAVFSQAGGTGLINEYKLVGEGNAFESGKNYLIVHEPDASSHYAMNTTYYNSDHSLGTTEVTPSNDIISNPAAVLVWNITGDNTDGYSIYNASINKYIAEDDENAVLSSTEAKPYDFTVNAESGRAVITLRSNDYMYFAGFEDSEYEGYYVYNGYSSGSLYLYKQQMGATLAYLSNPDCRTVDHISIKTEPTTTVYTEGETFDPTGLVITVTYNDASTTDVAYAGNESAFTFNPSTSTPLTTSHDNVVVTYAGHDANQGITVNAATKWTVTFKNGETTVSSQQVIDGHAIGTLPTSAGIASCDGTSTTFVGWTETKTTKKTDVNPGIINSETTIGEDKTYYALWATGTGLTSYTMKYESSSTTNMTGGNDAATVNLDKDVWSVIGSKGGHENYPGLSKNGYIVLYYGSTTKINEMTVSSLTSTPIYNIVVNYTSDQYNGGRVYVNSSLVTPTDNTYSIGATSFTMKSSGSGSTASQVRFSSLVINTGTPATGYITHCLTPCETPTFSPVAGDYEGAQNVTISTTTAGATIYYTTDGTTPTTSSTKYTDAVNVGAGTTTINAIAVKDGMADSEVASATYNIVTVVANPVISGTDCFESSSEVTITCTTAGATIYYTLDGSDPTSSGTRQSYSAPFTIDATKTVKAIATKSGLTSSSVVVETFTKKALTGITVGTAPTKDTYKEGQFFDPTGLVLTLSYNCGTDGSVSYAGHEGDFTFTPSLSTPLTTSHTSVTIEYGGLSTTQDITVNPLVLYTVHLFREGVEITSVTQTEEGGNVTLPTDWGTCSDYTFCGWSKTDNVTSAPTVTGETYQPTENTNLYAVYSQGMGEAWTLVNNVSDLEAGAYKIVATSYNYAMGTISGNNAPGAAIVKSGNVLSTVAGADYTLTESWQEGSTNWYIYNTAGKYLAAGSSSSAKLSLLDSPGEYDEEHDWAWVDDLNAAWAISFSGNSANIVAQGTYTYNKIQYNNSSNVFSGYASGQKAVSLYKYVASAQTYTTRPGCPVCDLTISKGSETSSQGTYTVTNTGSNKCPGISSVVTAVPADGYAFTGVTCSPATGSVGAIVDNVCTVSNITASTTITAVFTPIIYHNITWKVNDVDYTTGTPTSSWLEGMSLSTIKLPTAPANNTLQTACGSVARKFMGWSTSDVGWQTGSSAPAVLFTSAAQAGTQVGSMGSSDMIFYAVFAEEVVESTTWSEFVADGGMTSCDFVIAAIYDNKYYGLDNTYATTSADKVAGVDITSHVSQGTISAANAAGYKFTFTKTTYSTTSCYNIKGATCYYGAPASANFIAKSSVDGGSYYWTVGAGSHGTYNILNVQESGRSILFNGSPNYKYGAYSGSGSYYGAEILAIAVGEPTYQNYMTKCCPTPAAPTSLNATPAVDGGTVYWTKSANATAYEVQVNGGEWTNVGDVNNYTISGLACGGTAVNWYVRAKNNCYTSTAANHAFYTAQCNCDGFQFHYRDFSGNWNTNNICFTAVPGSANYDELTDEFALPYSNAFNVTYQGNPLPDSKTVTTEFQYMTYYNKNDYTFGTNPQGGNMGGALGKMHIYSNSGENNKYIRWLPTGYTLQMGDGSNWPTTYNFTGKTNAWNDTEWLTDLVTVTDAQIGGKIYVGLKTVNGYVWCNTYSEVINLNGLRTKAGADDSWVSGGLSTAYANKTGKFRIYADSGDKNWYVTFVPHLQLTYNANGGSGEMAGSDWRSVELDDAGRTVTVAANGFTAPDGKAFKGWNTNAAGTGDWINVANDWVLRENISNVLYAIWDQKYPVRYTGSTSGEIDHYEVAGATVDIKDDPVEVGYTFTGWTVTDDHANNIAVSGSSNNYYFTMPADGVTVHANMSPATSTLNYFDMGGSSCTAENKGSLPVSHTYGTPTIIPAGVKDGYRFEGWHLQSDCSDAAIAELSASVVYDDPLPIYAKWTQVHTISFYENGVERTDLTQQAGEGENVTMPASSGIGCGDYQTFLGWVVGTVDETTTKPATIYEAASSYTATGENVAMHALYTKVVGGDGSTYYEKTTTVTDGGKYLIAATNSENSYVYTGKDGSYPCGAYTAVTITNDKIVNVPITAVEVTVALGTGANAGKFSIYDGKYIYGSESSGGNLAWTSDQSFAWQMADGNIKSVGMSTNEKTFALRYNTSQPRFGCYQTTNANSKIAYLYEKKIHGTRYYSTGANLTYTWHSGDDNTQVTKVGCLGEIVPVTPATCSGKAFMGWSKTEVSAIQSAPIDLVDFNTYEMVGDDEFWAVYATQNGGKVGAEAAGLFDGFETEGTAQWNKSDNASLVTNGIISGSVYHGDFAVRFNMISNSTTPISITTKEKITDLSKISFYIKKTGGTDNKFDAQYSVNGTDWSNMTIASKPSGASFEYTLVTAEMPSVEDAYVRILVTPNGYKTAYNFFVDDVQFYSKPRTYWYADYSTNCDKPASTTLTYDVNGGAETIDPETTPGWVTLPTPTRGCYTFGGWAVQNVDGHALTYAGGEKYLFNHDVELLAQWTEDTEAEAATITFHKGYGHDEVVNVNCHTAFDAPSPETTCDAELTFVGWSTTNITAAEGQSEKPTLFNVDEPLCELLGNIDLYPVYKKGVASGSDYTAGATGNFILAAKYDDTWYAIRNNPEVNNGSIAGHVITVNTAAGVDYVLEQDATGYIWAVSNNGDNGQRFSDGTYYLYPTGGGTSGSSNLGIGKTGDAVTNFGWNITKPAKWHVEATNSTNKTTGRGMGFKTADLAFVQTALTNIDNDGTAYVEARLLPIYSIEGNYFGTPACPSVATTAGVNYMVSKAGSAINSCTGVLNVTTMRGTELTASLVSGDAKFTINVGELVEGKATYTVTYTPTAANETATAVIRFDDGTGNMRVADSKDADFTEITVHGCALPEKFVIAALVDGHYLALPENTTSEATTMSPVEVTYSAQLGGVFKVANSLQYSVNTVTDSIMTINSSAPFYANGSGFRSAMGAAAASYNWYVTREGDTYRVRNTGMTGTNFPSAITYNTTSSKFNMVKETTSGSNYYRDLYLLPILDFTDMQASVVEWFPTKVLVEVKKPNTEFNTSSVSVKIDGDVVATTVSDATYGTYLYEISGLDLVNNPMKQLLISYTYNEVSYATSMDIPIILSRVKMNITDELFTILGSSKYNNADLVLRDSAHLNADGSFVENTFRNVSIYPTAKLRIDDGYAFQATGQITLRGGKDEIYDGSKYEWTNYYGAEPQLYAKGNLYHTGNIDNIYYEKRVNTDKMYEAGLPTTVPFSNITYLDGTVIKPTDSLYISAWDGQAAADEKSKVWKYEKYFEDEELTAGVGYVVSCEPQYVGQNYSIIRFPIEHESGAAEAAESKYAPITYWHKDGNRLNSQGWNYIANPYLTYIKGTIMMIPDDKEKYSDKELKHVLYLSPDGSMYYENSPDSTEMLPFRSYFVQVPFDGKLHIYHDSRKPDAPARKQTIEDLIKFRLNLQQGEVSDKTSMEISETYSDNYVIGDDVEKMWTGYEKTAVYIIDKGCELVVDAVKPNHAKTWIPVGFKTTQKGELTFHLNVDEGALNIKHVYLKDMGNSEKITDMLLGDYTFTTDQTGKISNRFYIAVDFGNTPTDIDGASESDSDKIRKFVYEDKLFIEKNGIIYDATGKRVKL